MHNTAGLLLGLSGRATQRRSIWSVASGKVYGHVISAAVAASGTKAGRAFGLASTGGSCAARVDWRGASLRFMQLTQRDVTGRGGIRDELR